MKIKEIIKLALACLWQSVIAFTMPFCMGLIYMDITGNSKGYGYDLGAEKDIYILFGIIELIIWLLLAVPCSIYVIKKLNTFGKKYVVIAVAVMIILFVSFVYMVGGWSEFASWFGIGIK